MAKTLSALSELAFPAAANDNDPTQSDADRIAEYKAAMVNGMRARSAPAWHGWLLTRPTSRSVSRSGPL